ncbi:MAG: hypothetical protein KAI47_12945, partial [Deltaproteobacteria bacterium]|nr:hypothetical protein [Deltaproteobacteria bacterium]
MMIHAIRPNSPAMLLASWVLLIALPACKRAPSTPKVSLPPLRSTAKTLPAPLGRLPKGTALVPI